MRRPLVALFVLAACADVAPESTATPGFDLRRALAAGDDAGFDRVVAAPVLEFPRDHGAHPTFRTEWWYFTGNVATAAGRPFGFELVFFRQALRPPSAAPRPASLASDQLVLAHAAVTDVQAQRFTYAERVQRLDGLRASLSPAGQPLQLQCGDWSARARAGGDGFLPLELAARADGFALQLELRAGKPIVLQGAAGLSQKSAAPGNASVYYSAPRLQVAGTVEAAGERHAVTGTAWCDREWGTSALGADQVGWDWFSLQFDDDTELMWYRLRREDGAEDPHSQGLFVHADGRSERLRAGEVTAEPVGAWRAADGRAIYPARWRLSVPRLDLELEVTPRVPDQELRTLVRYWEGAIAAKGRRRGVPTSGVGYLEMTGYAR